MQYGVNVSRVTAPLSRDNPFPRNSSITFTREENLPDEEELFLRRG
jgi:hypothetical protein